MAMLLQLRMQGGKIRKDLFGESFYYLPLSEQCLLDTLLVPLLSERPHHTGCGGPVEVVMNGTLANEQARAMARCPSIYFRASALLIFRRSSWACAWPRWRHLLRST
jgi:hypothetical protein